jgi:hypothetical protein
MATPLASGYRFSGQAREKLSYGQVKRLAKSYGLPGDAIAQIAKGESGLYADVQQRDPGDRMVGYGLLQMTPNAWGKGSAAYRKMQSLGGVEAMRDPSKNMEMARFLYKAAGNKLTPWYGTRFLTNRKGEGTLGPIRATGATDAIGTPGTPAQTHLQFDPNSATGEALGTLLKLPARQRPPVTAPTAPSFSAAPVMASPIAQAAQQAQPEEPRTDLTSALQKIDRLGQNTGAQPTVTTPASGGGGGGGGGGSDVAFRGKPGSGVLELIHNDGGKGYGIKNGKVVDAPSTYSGVWAGHANHVHVAAGPSTVVALGKLAQRMGLHVGENPHFGGVNPVHTGGSYHYKGEAIDVSGDPKRMNAYSRAVEKYNRTRRLPS